MRDNRRVRDRFELNLESRQVALLFIMGLVILTLVFALGIIVGRGLTQGPAVAQGTSSEGTTLPSSALDQAPVATDVMPPEPVAPPADADQAPVLKFFDEKGTAARPAKAAAGTGTAPEPDKTAAKPAAPTASKPTAQPAVAKPAAPKAAEPAAAAPKAKPAAEAAVARPFTIQVSAFQERKQADQMMGRLRDKGYDAFITKASIPGKGVWFRVRVGQFGSRAEAEAVAAKLKRGEGISTYVTLNQ